MAGDAVLGDLPKCLGQSGLESLLPKGVLKLPVSHGKLTLHLNRGRTGFDLVETPEAACRG